MNKNEARKTYTTIAAYSYDDKYTIKML